MNKDHIAIIGLGYVGLPLCLQFARSGVTVLGVDIDPGKIEAITAGRSYIKHIESSTIAEMTASGKLSATTDFSRISEVGAVIICVPTPLNKNREPDISFILVLPGWVVLVSVFILRRERALRREHARG